MPKVSTSFKYYFWIGTTFAINALHVVFFNNNDKYDVYYFYEHNRFLTNILYDIGVLYTITVLSYFLRKLSWRVFEPLFIASLFSWVFYFAVYWQMASLLIIPLYICIAILYQTKLVKRC